jgi:hypothetical protein
MEITREQNGKGEEEKETTRFQKPLNFIGRQTKANPATLSLSVR